MRQPATGDRSNDHSSESNEDDATPPVAGIPVATDCDQQLWECLRDRPVEFPSALVEQLCCLTSASPAEAQATEAQGNGSEVNQQMVNLVYLWAVVEAYCIHPLIQESMRGVLGRGGSNPLAAGEDAKRLVGEVQLLWGSEGQYKVGAVPFQNGTASTSAGVLGGGLRYGVLSPLSFSSHTQVPRPISRAAAARAYTMYTYWGYFNRHMTLRRACEAAVFGTDAGGLRPRERAWLPVTPAPGSSRAETQYGEVAKVWRYFENVPEELSEMRTREAAAAADKHVRTLFGEECECITTMACWKHMCDEAQWFGRALYDAEQLALMHASDCATHTVNW